MHINLSPLPVNSHDSLSHIDDVSTIATLHDEMEGFDQMQNRSDAAYGYIKLIERLTGEGAANPGNDGLMGQPGAEEILVELEKRLDDVLEDTDANDVHELVVAYFNSTKKRIDNLLQAQKINDLRTKEVKGGWRASA